MSEKKPSAIGKTIAIAILCALCGFGGGVFANITGIGTPSNRTNTQKETGSVFQNPGDSFGTLPFEDQSTQEEEEMPFTSGAALGITVQEVTTTDEMEGGVYVMSVADESNAKDTIQAGDRIVKIDNQEVTGVETLANYVLQQEAGDTVTLTVKRNGETFMTDVVLISRNMVSSEQNRRS